MTTPNLELPEVPEAIQESSDEINAGFASLDAVVQLSVLDKDLTAPPVGAVQGDRYIVGAGATGAWAGRDRWIAAMGPSGYQFYAPRPGWIAWVLDESTPYVYIGTSWRVVPLVPPGGAAGQVLTKTSGVDFATSWSNSGSGGGSDPAAELNFIEDFIEIYSGSGGPWNSNQSGSGATISSVAEERHPGILVPTTGTASSGTAGVSVHFASNIQTNAFPLILGADQFIFEGLIKLPILPDGTNTFVAKIGLASGALSTADNGVFAEVRWDGSAARWRLTARAADVETTSDALVGPAADTWYYLRIEVSSAGAELFVANADALDDPTSVATISTGLPTAAVGGPAFWITKSAGTTSRQLWVDLVKLRQIFSTPRYVA